jgi:SWIM zinc finger
MNAATQQVGTPEPRGSGWFVPSGRVGYFVERLEGRWRCTCPSFRWRHRGTCKHIEAVWRVSGKEVLMD